MTFRVGMKVACIEAAEGTCCSRCEPDKNNIATVSNVFIWWGQLALELKEFPSPRCEHAGPGWLASGFRPIVDQNPSIEIFTRMLLPQGENADA